MVRRYAHLAPNHLTEHARQIDSIFANFCRRCPKYVPQGKISDWRKLISDWLLNGTPYRIRTCDLRLRRPLLYPAELRAPWEASASRSETRGIIRSTSVESIHFARKLRAYTTLAKYPHQLYKKHTAGAHARVNRLSGQAQRTNNHVITMVITG